MRELLRYLRPYGGKVALAMGMIAVSTFCNLMLPTIMSRIVNDGVYNADFPYILRCCVQMLLVALLGLCSILMGVRTSSQVVAAFSADMRRDIFRKVSTLTFEEFGAMGTAALLTRSTHDVETVSWVASMLSGTVVTIPVLFLGGVLLALSKDVALSLILLCFIPTVFVAVVVIGRRIDPLWQKSDAYVDRQNDIMRERLWGIRVIRAFNREPYEQDRVAQATRVMAENIIKANTSMGVVSPLALFVFNAAAVLILYVGAGRMEALGAPAAGDIFAIIQYISLVMNGVVMAAFAIVMYPHAKVAAGRIAQVTGAESMGDGTEEKDVTFRGDVDFDHVTFRYQDAVSPPSGTSTSTSRPARRSASSAAPAPANPPWSSSCWASACPRRGASALTAWTPASGAAAPCGGTSAPFCRRPPSTPAPSGTTSSWETPPPVKRPCGRPPGSPRSGTSSTPWRRATTTSWSRRGRTCPEARSSAWPSPGRC